MSRTLLSADRTCCTSASPVESGVAGTSAGTCSSFVAATFAGLDFRCRLPASASAAEAVVTVSSAVAFSSFADAIFAGLAFRCRFGAVEASTSVGAGALVASALPAGCSSATASGVPRLLSFAEDLAAAEDLADALAAEDLAAGFGGGGAGSSSFSSSFAEDFAAAADLAEPLAAGDLAPGFGGGGAGSSSFSSSSSSSSSCLVVLPDFGSATALPEVPPSLALLLSPASSAFAKPSRLHVASFAAAVFAGLDLRRRLAALVESATTCKYRGRTVLCSS
mmetsp:Transcript_123367/g.227249  ORF Transcript_123367/g.227249 Transcript_123367/m.227249 type:complete len:279 (+) Transcript_123367:447-1283(+)